MNKQVRTMDQLKDSQLLYEKKLPAFGYYLLLGIVFLLVFAVFWSTKTPKIYMIHSSGVVQSSNKNYVMSPYTGKIVKMNVAEGDAVEEGDVLFSVESTDLNLQEEQLNGQKTIYEIQIAQYEKLVQSIKDDTNYFSASSSEDNLYYSQYEAYKSQVVQNTFDASTYKSYGYTDEQIQAEVKKNQGKLSEIYHSAIQLAQRPLLEAENQLQAIEAQLAAIETGKSGYNVIANASGTVHMLSEYKSGMVVQAASAIASISSENDEYEIEAFVSPADTARITVGDTVDIAPSGLSQSVYGTISGKIVSIDSDVSSSQNNEGENSSYFKIKVLPDTEYLVSKEGDKVNIYNGMAVQARIEYDKVTYFDYVLESLGVLTR